MKHATAKHARLMLALATTVLVHAQAQAQAQATAAATPADGKSLFTKNCAACHQATGAGIPGAFPALKANPSLQGDPNPVIATVLNGRAGMPAFAASLGDPELAAILTYARSAWTNKASAIDAAQVTTIRSASGAPASIQEKGAIVH